MSKKAQNWIWIYLSVSLFALVSTATATLPPAEQSNPPVRKIITIKGTTRKKVTQSKPVTSKVVQKNITVAKKVAPAKTQKIASQKSSKTKVASNTADKVRLPKSPALKVSVASLDGMKPEEAGIPPVVSGVSTLQTDALGLYVHDNEGRKVYYTVVPELQRKAQELLHRGGLTWGAIVAVDPRSGRVLAQAGLSKEQMTNSEITTRATFPAASLFKLVTAAAAIEKKGLGANTPIYFRGGNYTLTEYNYLPDLRKDRRQMSFADALGKSCNPVFARIALEHLNSDTLTTYAKRFGFNSQIPFDVHLDPSSFAVTPDEYNFARTAAGFGEVRVSPLHAAMMAAAIANQGQMMRPFMVERVVKSSGAVEYQARSQKMGQSILRGTAQQLLMMMKSTVEQGTARRQFSRAARRTLGTIDVAAKTGTLSGDNPKGMYYWFVAAAPADHPEIAIASLVISPGRSRVKGTELGREFLEYYFDNSWNESPTVAPVSLKTGAENDLHSPEPVSTTNF